MFLDSGHYFIRDIIRLDFTLAVTSCPREVRKLLMPKN
jgi:hypothetical protein